MKKIFLFLVIAVSIATIAHAQTATMTLVQYVNNSEVWEVTQPAPQPSTVRLTPTDQDFEIQFECEAYLFEPPANGSSVIRAWILIFNPDNQTTFAKPVNAVIPNPPPNWNDSTFRNKKNITYLPGSGKEVYIDPISITIKLVFVFTGGDGDPKQDLTKWKYTGYKWYASNLL